MPPGTPSMSSRSRKRYVVEVPHLAAEGPPAGDDVESDEVEDPDERDELDELDEVEADKPHEVEADTPTPTGAKRKRLPPPSAPQARVSGCA